MDVKKKKISQKRFLEIIGMSRQRMNEIVNSDKKAMQTRRITLLLLSQFSEEEIVEKMSILKAMGVLQE